MTGGRALPDVDAGQGGPVMALTRPAVGRQTAAASNAPLCRLVLPFRPCHTATIWRRGIKAACAKPGLRRQSRKSASRMEAGQTLPKLRRAVVSILQELKQQE